MLSNSVCNRIRDKQFCKTEHFMLTKQDNKITKLTTFPWSTVNMTSQNVGSKLWRIYIVYKSVDHGKMLSICLF